MMNNGWKLDESWRNVDTLIIYGFGKVGQGNIDSFIDEFSISYIIDNSIKHRRQKYRGIAIIDFEQYLDTSAVGDKIVILAAGKALLSIKKLLIDKGMKEYIDFADMGTFLYEWNLRFKGLLCVGRCGVSITTKCTFNCQNCNLLMPYHKNPKNYSLELLKRDVDLFFSVVDKVASFVVVGGEPLLHPELSAYLEYLGTMYGQKISNIQLITNGSLLPDEQLLTTIKKYNVEVRLSDYSREIAYEKRLCEFRKLMKSFEIKFIEFKQIEWIDFGFPHDKVNMGDTDEQLRKHMLQCNGMCYWLHEGKFYFCSNAWAAREVGLFQLNENQDYLELEKLIASGEEGKKKLLSFYQGNVESGYMSFCKVCRGFQSKQMIKAAIQVK